MDKYGLIGNNIDYSFSKTFFNSKFKKEESNNSYENFDISDLSQLSEVLLKNPKLKGLNVTIPYKESIIKYLDRIDSNAQKIGAINTIKITAERKLIGYNTDYIGFKESLKNLLPISKKNALVLGTGGASKAIVYALKSLNYKVTQVSRVKKEGITTYAELNKEVMIQHQLIINCTPLGTFPNIDQYPSIPYQYVTKNHLMFDLTYNPLETMFIKLSKEQGARISNGLKMLEFQAEEAWSIWKANNI
ncbi:shikimate dehydrogenase [Flavobacteriaceae bacterium]|mgnify:FL=1|jgi:shikimate dehydrogenase|nr:shikimate dehydrogenase [Flavobacteriaceae bacterium]